MIGFLLVFFNSNYADVEDYRSEMPRTLLNKKFLKLKFNYVIGHGMAFKNEVIKKIGGYPEDEINEDNVLGYRLNKENIAIYAIPILEKIGFAKKTSVYIQ